MILSFERETNHLVWLVGQYSMAMAVGAHQRAAEVIEAIEIVCETAEHQRVWKAARRWLDNLELVVDGPVTPLVGLLAEPTARAGLH